MKWIKNTENKPDAMLSLGVIALGVILVKFFLSEITIGSVTFGQLDALVIASILTPTLGAYVARRHSDKLTHGQKEKKNEKN